MAKAFTSVHNYYNDTLTITSSVHYSHSVCSLFTMINMLCTLFTEFSGSLYNIDSIIDYTKVN